MSAPWRRDALFFVAYLVTALLGRATRFEGTALTLVWPAAGVGFLWMLSVWHQRSDRVRPLALLAVSTAVVNAATGAPPAMSVVFGVANTVQLAVAAEVHHRLRPADWRPRRPADLVLVAVAAAAGAAAATVVVPLSAALITGSPFWPTALQWIVRNVGSMVVIGTAGLVLADRGARPGVVPPPRLEQALCHVGLALTYVFVFSDGHGIPLGWSVLAFAAWSGTRMTTRNSAGLVLASAFAVVAFTLAGHGPFAGRDPLTEVLLAHAFVVVLTVVTFTLALGRDERAELVLRLATRTRELAESEEHYRLVADRAGDAIGRVARDGTVLWTSPSTPRVFGWSVEHLESSTRAEVVHPDDVPALDDAGEAVFTGASDVELVQFRVPQADGTIRWIETQISAVHDADGRVTEMVTLARDVTERVIMRQRIEEQGRDAELARAQLIEALDASPDGFTLFRLERDAEEEIRDALLETVNAVVLGLGQQERAALVGRDLRGILPQAVALGLWDACLETASTGAAQRLRLDMRETDWPAILDVLVVSVPGDRLLLTWRDVTEAVRREDLLSAAYDETAAVRAVLQTAIDAMVDGFVVHRVERDPSRPGHDGRGEIVAVRAVLANAAALTRTQLSTDEVADTELRDVLPDAASSGLWDALVATVTHGDPHTVRLHQVDEHGDWTGSVDVTVSLVADDQVVTVFRDATDEELTLRRMAEDRESYLHAAMHDPLTGLPNRLALRTRLRTSLTECTPGERVGVVFVDLDGFKQVNDDHGHAAGDLVLRAVAERLTGLLRPEDTAAHLSGDEFVLVLRDLREDWTGEEFLARARTRLAEPVVVRGDLGLAEVRPAASFGLVLADPQAGDVTAAVDDLVARADSLMYAQKRARRSLTG